jgi:hypothetical protein
MVFAVGRRLAEAVAENPAVALVLLGALALAVAWPKIVRRIERRSRRR